MPIRKRVEQHLLRTMLKHDGVIREFGAGEKIVDEIADEFALSGQQRAAALETIYRKENRLKNPTCGIVCCFRAADSLANENLVTRQQKHSN